MNDSDLKELARLSVSEGSVSPDVQRYVLEKLSHSELKSYLLHLKREIKNSKVFIRTAGKPDKETLEGINKIFEGKKVELNFSQMPKLGGGIQIEYKDNLVELSLKALVEKSLKNLRESV